MPTCQPQLKGLGSVLAGGWNMPVEGFFSYRDYPFLRRPGPPYVSRVCVYDDHTQSSSSQSEQAKDVLPTDHIDVQSLVPQR